MSMRSKCFNPCFNGICSTTVPSAASLVPIILIAAFFVWPGASSLFQSNMGAVAQTRAELAIYSWPEWNLQDELRRSHRVDLSKAIDHYNRALLKDPMNVSAHRRLGQIKISTGQYEMARQHLETAYDSEIHR